MLITQTPRNLEREPGEHPKWRLQTQTFLKAGRVKLLTNPNQLLNHRLHNNMFVGNVTPMNSCSPTLMES